MMLKDRIENAQNDSVFGRNLYKYVQFCSWARWWPDFILDLINQKQEELPYIQTKEFILDVSCVLVSLYGGISQRLWQNV